MALRLSDIVSRRTELGSAECPPIKVLKDIANVMAVTFDCSDEKKTDEINTVLDYYSPLQK